MAILLTLADLHNHNTRGALKKTSQCTLQQGKFLWNPLHHSKSVKDWNNLQDKVVFEFNQEQVSIPKLISTLKKYFLTS